MTTWQTKVLRLQDRGWTLAAIAEETRASIGAISDLKKGRTLEPRANVALRLERIYADRIKPPIRQRLKAA